LRVDFWKPAHFLLWAIWMDAEQPKWLYPVLFWVNQKRIDGGFLQ